MKKLLHNNRPVQELHGRTLHLDQAARVTIR